MRWSSSLAMRDPASTSTHLRTIVPATMISKIENMADLVSKIPVTKM